MDSQYSAKYAYFLFLISFLLAIIICPHPIFASEIGHENTLMFQEELDPFYSFLLKEKKQSSAGQLWTDRVLQEGLTLEGALRITLLNNPCLKGIYESLGITDQELIEAFLTSFEGDFLGSFLENLQCFIQKNLSKEEVSCIMEDVSSLVLDIIFETKNAFYFWEASEKVFNIRSLVETVAFDGVEAAIKLHEDGKISDGTILRHKLKLEEEKEKKTVAKQDILKTKKKLEILMGIEADNSVIPSFKPFQVPLWIPTATHVERESVENNKNLQRIREKIRVNSFLSEKEKKILWAEYREKVFTVRSVARQAAFHLQEAFQKNCYLEAVSAPLEKQLAEEIARQYSSREINSLEYFTAKQKELQMHVKGIYANREFFIAEAKVEFLLSGKTLQKMTKRM